MPDTAPTIGLVLDCRDPDELASFWAAALRYVQTAREGAYVVLAPDGRPGPELLLQRVPEAKAVKNRMHLDLEVPEIEVEAARLEALGARRAHAEPIQEHGERWIVMTDPEGNEFCVCDASA